MLAGPAGSGDYFDSIGRGFPTPNESSLRTGLTPGGGGSMFPAPSPNSQALFQALQNGGATPGTVDFHRTAINAAARSKNNQFGQTSNPQDQNPLDAKMDKSQQEQFASHDAEAANGLFMLAKGGQTNSQYAMANQQIQQQQQQAMQSNQSVQENHRRNTASMGSLSGHDISGQQSDDHEEVSKPNTRSARGKKTGKAQAAANNRRKADVTPQKSSNKRSKGNSGSVNVDPSLTLEPPDDDEDDSNEEMPTHDANGRKMTDEEKRKNFLERNR
jgi:ATF/CREB family transcription factor